MISVEATTIDMKNAPRAAIAEGAAAEYFCDTDSAYPNPPVVLWYVEDIPVDINNGHTIDNYTSPGDYHGKKTNSTLRLTTKREMNKKKVKCSLENNGTKLIEHYLNVRCK